MMRQSSRLPSWLPAFFFLAWPFGYGGGSEAQAQDRYRVLNQENFRREPGPNGRLLASVTAGTPLLGDSARSGWVQVSLEGWIWAQSVRPISAGGFDLEVRPGGENLRASPNGTVYARLSAGFRLQEIGRDGAWVRVARDGWMWGRSLERLPDATSTPPEGAPPEPEMSSSTSAGRLSEIGDSGAQAADSVGLEYGVTSQIAGLFSTPDGDSTGRLETDQPVRIVGRSGEWVRVQAEGWVRERDLRPGSDGVLVGVSAAEVRARPRTFEGQLVQWTVQYIAVQTATDLRREIPTGRRYMLARGPLPEFGFVYILLDEAQVEALERVSPLAHLVVLARIRVGRSQFLGNPVVELIEMAVREP